MCGLECSSNLFASANATANETSRRCEAEVSKWLLVNLTTLHQSSAKQLRRRETVKLRVSKLLLINLN